MTSIRGGTVSNRDSGQPSREPTKDSDEVKVPCASRGLRLLYGIRNSSTMAGPNRAKCFVFQVKIASTFAFSAQRAIKAS